LGPYRDCEATNNAETHRYRCEVATSPNELKHC